RWGRPPVPPVGELPYLLTMGPHSFYWFALTPTAPRRGVTGERPREAPVPRIVVRDTWTELLDPVRYNVLERALRAYLAGTVFNHGRRRTLRDVTIRNVFRPPYDSPAALVLADAESLDGETQLRGLRLGFAVGDEAAAVPAGAVIAEVMRGGAGPDRDRPRVGVLFDARTDPGYCADTLRG